MYQKAFSFISILLLSFACAAPKLVPDASATIDHLGICVDYDPSIPPQVQRSFDRQLNDFIAKYNTEYHMFQLQRCGNPETETLRLFVSSTKLLSSGKQTAGILLSGLGLSLPFVLGPTAAPIYAGFYFFPKDISKVNMSLSDDISESEGYWIKRMFFNPGLFMTMKKQLHQHTRKFDWFLDNTLAELEHSYKKNHKQKEEQNLITEASQENKH